MSVKINAVVKYNLEAVVKFGNAPAERTSRRRRRREGGGRGIELMRPLFVWGGALLK